MSAFIRECTKRYGKAKLVLKHNKFYVESEHHDVLRELLRDTQISQARIVEDEAGAGPSAADKDGFVVTTRAEEMEENLKMLREPIDEDSDEEEEDSNENGGGNGSGGGGGGGGSVGTNGKKPKLSVAFQIKANMVEVVKKQAIELDYPLMEEYDFRNDKTNPNVPMDLKPHARIRRYQERSLAKMFGNGRARSGIIVLPCGAGKTLTGVTAAQTIKKSVVCLCTNAVSVLQWKFQFQLWTDIPDDRICCFTSDKKEQLHPESCVLITTYTMISFSGVSTE